MDRQIVYPQSLPQDTDILNTNKNALVGLGLLALDIIGAGTTVSGLPCAATAPATLGVLIGPGRIYSLQNVDGSAYGSLAADVTDQVVKQGIQLGNVMLPTPAPATANFAINYLIEAAYQDSDTNAVVLPFFNANNPQGPSFQGQNNNGLPLPTKRQGLLVVQAKAGIAAATGTQATPAPDVGFVGLYVVTVANGQAAVTASNIVLATNAPFLTANLPQFNGVVNANGQWIIKTPVSGTALTVNCVNGFNGIDVEFMGAPASSGININTNLNGGAVGFTAANSSAGAAAATIGLSVGNNSIRNLLIGKTGSNFATAFFTGGVGSVVGEVAFLQSGGGIPVIIGVSAVENIQCIAGGVTKVPNVGTTASAANAFLDSANANNILRSTSSIRYKQDVTNLEQEIADRLFALQPIRYRSKAEADDPNLWWYGLIAEEVAKVDPRLCHYRKDENGNLLPDGVQYERLSVLLLDVVQRMHTSLATKGIL